MGERIALRRTSARRASSSAAAAPVGPAAAQAGPVAAKPAPAAKAASPAQGDPPAQSDPPAQGNVAEFAVSELASAIKSTLEGRFGYVRLRGEVSGYRGPHASGHCYFGLKDERAKIDAVVWRGVFSKLRFKPEEGMEVIATGKVTTYPNSSKYQIMIEALEPAGAGALMALLEARKATLAGEGLFAAERKRALPFLPRTVGIITSPTGAVIRDMLAGFRERFPTTVLLWPVRVQGESSGREVTAALRGMNALPVKREEGDPGALTRPDVIIVARGGGSLEDLWGFNDEELVRAAAASTVPIISAVGHETDWTLIDLVADARAPTPTKAAEWAVPKHSDLLAQVSEKGARLGVAMVRTLEHAHADLRAAKRGLPRLEDIIALPRQRFDAVERQLDRAFVSHTRDAANTLARIAGRLQPETLSRRVTAVRERAQNAHDRLSQAFAVVTERRRARLEASGKLLGSLGYQSVLARGYALVRDAAGRPLREATGVTRGQRLEVELADGRVAVEALRDGAAPKPPPKDPPAGIRPRRKPKITPGGGQGSLF
ncbi:MAG: exodeoxyribonuclease VII large subunit [Pseudomonadota bacterium]